MLFGEGGRRCLGERLGMAVMKVLLGMIASKLYDLVGVHDDDDYLRLSTTNTLMVRQLLAQ